MATSNINFIVSKPNSGLNIGSNLVEAPTATITQYEVNKLNVSLVGFTNPTAVKVDLELPDGTTVTDLHLASSLASPTLFSVILDRSVFGDLAVGELNHLTVTKISVISLGYIYSTTTEYVLNMYRTDTNSNYIPTDIDNLYILINELQERLNTI